MSFGKNKSGILKFLFDVKNEKDSDLTCVTTGVSKFFQSGINSFKAIGSKIAPDNI